MLPAGVRRNPLTSHEDDRGAVREMYRREWFEDDPELLQWNHVRSNSNVLRGVHAHFMHDDFLFMAGGIMDLGLYDLRPDSPTEGCSTLIRLHADRPELVRIPTGVAHGFYFPVQSVLIYGTTHYWNRVDELGCRWDDPALHIPWAIESQPRLSPRDAFAGSLAKLKRAFTSTVSKNA